MRLYVCTTNETFPSHSLKLWHMTCCTLCKHETFYVLFPTAYQTENTQNYYEIFVTFLPTYSVVKTFKTVFKHRGRFFWWGAIRNLVPTFYFWGEISKYHCLTMNIIPSLKFQPADNVTVTRIPTVPRVKNGYSCLPSVGTSIRLNSLGFTRSVRTSKGLSTVYC